MLTKKCNDKSGRYDQQQPFLLHRRRRPCCPLPRPAVHPPGGTANSARRPHHAITLSLSFSGLHQRQQVAEITSPEGIHRCLCSRAGGWAGGGTRVRELGRHKGVFVSFSFDMLRVCVFRQRKNKKNVVGRFFRLFLVSQMYHRCP